MAPGHGGDARSHARRRAGAVPRRPRGSGAAAGPRSSSSGSSCSSALLHAARVFPRLQLGRRARLRGAGRGRGARACVAVDIRIPGGTARVRFGHRHAATSPRPPTRATVAFPGGPVLHGSAPAAPATHGFHKVDLLLDRARARLARRSALARRRSASRRRRGSVFVWGRAQHDTSSKPIQQGGQTCPARHGALVPAPGPRAASDPDAAARRSSSARRCSARASTGRGCSGSCCSPALPAADLRGDPAAGDGRRARSVRAYRCRGVSLIGVRRWPRRGRS